MEEDKKYQTQEVNIEEEQTQDADVLAARTVFVDIDTPVDDAEEAESEPEGEEVSSDEAESEAETETETEDEAETDAEHEEEKAQELSAEDREIVERIRLRKIEAERKRRRHKRSMITGIVLAVLALTSLILSFTPIFTVDSIEVKGNTHYSADEIISMGHAVPGKNLIYKADKAVIQKYLEQNPYIKSAEVNRKFPSTLVINVKERTPVMTIRYDDDYLVLDREGVLLQKSRTKPKLTIIEGNIIKKIKLSQELGTTDENQMRKTIELVQAMSDNDLYFVKIDMSDKYSTKAYVYDTLIVKNDYETLVENIKNGKLHLVLDKLFSESIKRGTITFNEDGTSTFIPGF